MLIMLMVYEHVSGILTFEAVLKLQKHDNQT